MNRRHWLKFATWFFSWCGMASLDEARRRFREMGRKLRAMETAQGVSGYSRQLKYAGERRREATLTAQELGDIPKIADPIRRRDCLADFRLFCDTYGKATFYLPWGDVHKRSA